MNHGLKCLTLAFVVFLTGCAFPKAQTEAEKLSGYTYIPLDPFPVQVVPNKDGEDKKIDLSDLADPLRLLPDHAVRNAIQTIDVDGNVSFGVGKFEGDVGYYRLTVDYVNSDTVAERFFVLKRMKDRATGELVVVSPFSVDLKEYVFGTEEYWVVRKDPKVESPTLLKNQSNYTFNADDWYEVNIPLYVGIGVRATATIQDAGASLNITGLGTVGIEAETKSLRGTLVLQSIGINGEKVASLIPIQSELNRTTTQNAIVAIASIKPLIADDKTTVVPRLLGMYLPMPADVQLINAIVSAIAEEDISWTPVTIEE